MKKITPNTLVLAILLYGLFVWNLLTPSQALSASERRRLAQRPEPTVDTLFNGSYMEDYDRYATDQFAGRAGFRRLKLRVEFQLLRKSDSGGLFASGGQLFKQEYPLRTDKVQALCDKLRQLAATFPEGAAIYYAMVPDKNAYLPEGDGHLAMDYAALEALLAQQLPEWSGISLLDALALNDYYTTDLHWRQERLQPVLQRLFAAMDIPAEASLEGYELHSHSPFYGAYHGQMAGLAQADTICWLTDEVLEQALVTSVERPGEQLPVYHQAGLAGMDGYDLFLHGAQAIVTLHNPAGATGRRLVLFRDSFGSALAPLLLQGYDTVTLVDLRYVSPALLGDYLSYEGADILFLYSGTLINNSDAIRG